MTAYPYSLPRRLLVAVFLLASASARSQFASKAAPAIGKADMHPRRLSNSQVCGIALHLLDHKKPIF